MKIGTYGELGRSGSTIQPSPSTAAAKPTRIAEATSAARRTGGLPRRSMERARDTCLHRLKQCPYLGTSCSRHLSQSFWRSNERSEWRRKLVPGLVWTASSLRRPPRAVQAKLETVLVTGNVAARAVGPKSAAAIAQVNGPSRNLSGHPLGDLGCLKVQIVAPATSLNWAYIVGLGRFELPASSPPVKRANQAAPQPVCKSCKA